MHAPIHGAWKIARETLLATPAPHWGALLPTCGPIDHTVVLCVETAEVEGLPPTIASAYPGQVSLVLKATYRDLVIESDLIAVTLSFAREWQRIRIPIASVRQIYDPDAAYLVQFNPLEPLPAEANDIVINLADFRKGRT